MIRALDALLQFHSEALAARARRQQLLASNIANADTPGYRARDLDFAALLRDQSNGMTLARTHAGHRAVAIRSREPEFVYRVPLQSALDGNTVELDFERAQFSDNALRYEAGLVALNAHIRHILAAIQG